MNIKRKYLYSFTAIICISFFYWYYYVSKNINEIVSESAHHKSELSQAKEEGSSSQVLDKYKSRDKPKLKLNKEDQASLNRLRAATSGEEERAILEGSSLLVKAIRAVSSTGNWYFDFYGRIIDQYGDPVTNAKVEMEVGGGVFAGGDGVVRVISDHEGYFSVKEARGGSLGIIKMNRPGYEIDYKKQAIGFSSALDEDEHLRSTNKDLFSYGKKDKAFVYIAWKLTDDIDSNDLHTGRTSNLYLYGNRQIYTVDLFAPNGRESQIQKGKQSGQIYISFYRDKNSLIEGASKYGPAKNPWRLSVEVIGGGLIEVENPLYMMRAPVDGYVSKWEMSNEDQKSIFDDLRHFYIKTKDGMYGRINIQLRTSIAKNRKQNHDGEITFNYSINKSGDTNVASFKGIHITD